MSRRSRVIAIAALACTLGCDVRDTLGPGGSPTVEPAFVSGRVLDYRTGRGMPGVAVHLSEGPVALTDSSGLYRLPRPASAPLEETMNIRAVAAGFENAVVSPIRRGDTTSIPVIFLRARPEPVMIGPEGGTIRGDGFTIEIPADALDTPVPISAVPTYPRSVEISGMTGTREIRAMDLQPRGLRFSRPIRITLSRPAAHAVDGTLDLLVREPKSGTWHRIGGAVSGQGGQSVEFQLDAVPMDEIAVVGNAIYYIDTEAKLTRKLDRLVAPCGQAAVESRESHSPAAVPFAERHRLPLFNNNYIEAYINAIQQEDFGLVFVGGGTPYQLVTDVFDDLYVGIERGEFWVMENGNEQMIADEGIGFSYHRIRTVHSVARCHLQGIA